MSCDLKETLRQTDGHWWLYAMICGSIATVLVAIQLFLSGKLRPHFDSRACSAQTV